MTLFPNKIPSLRLLLDLLEVAEEKIEAPNHILIIAGIVNF